MNVYLFIGINILVISFVAYFVVDHKHEFVPFKPESVCFKTSSSNKLCAQCFKRDPKVHGNSAFKIQSKQGINLLKIADQHTFLSCHDYLQLIANQKESKHNKPISIQSVGSVSKLLLEINAVFQNTKSKYEIVEPRYHQFVVYNWEDSQSKEISVVFPNFDNYKAINFRFLIGFHFILLFLSLFFLADSRILIQQSRSIKIFLAFIVVLLELYLLEIKGETSLHLCRIFVLNIGFLRLKVNIYKVLAILALGLPLSYFQFTFLTYVACVLCLVLYYEQPQPELKDIHRYLLSLYSLFLLNHLYLFQFALFLNDFTNLAIDLCLIILVPLGLLILPKQQQLSTYHPVGGNMKGASLNDEEFQQPTTI